MAMLPQAQVNIAKLEAIWQTSTEKKAEIVQQMEIARGPLLKEYSELERQKSSREARCRQLIHKIKTFRTEMLEITGIIHSKRESVRALEKIQERQFAKLSKKKHPDGGPMIRNMYHGYHQASSQAKAGYCKDFGGYQGLQNRDLQNWISQLEARDSSNNLDKVLADLESVRQENGTLQNELRARTA